jgi:hypothetical protein
VVDIIAAVFGVLENGTLAGFAGVYIATVVREIGQRNGRIWRIVSRAFGMKFFKAQVELTLRQFCSERAY